MFWIILIIIIFVLLISIRQINQYQRGAKFTMGRYTSYRGTWLAFSGSYFSDDEKS